MPARHAGRSTELWFLHPANTGLGDRLGQLAQLATIGRLLDLTVVTR